jgi:hypothetical protein
MEPFCKANLHRLLLNRRCRNRPVHKMPAQGVKMLHLTSHEFAGRRILLIENDLENAIELTSSVEACGGTVLGCVTNALAAISYVKLWKVDAVVAHTETLNRAPFPLHEVMSSLGVALLPVTSFDDWFDAEEEEVGVEELTTDFALNEAA